MSNIINELKKQRKPDDKNMDSLVQKLYDDCLKSITFKNKHGVTNMIYEVQRIHPGFPLHNVERVSVKLNALFKSMGFKTMFVPKNKIYISW